MESIEQIESSEAEKLDFDSPRTEPKEPKGFDRVKVTVNLKRSLYQDALDIANEEDESISTVIRSAIRDYVRRKKEKSVSTF